MQFSQLLYVVCEISTFSIAFPVVGSFFFFKRSEGSIKIFYYFLYLSALLDLLSIISSNLKIHNTLLSHIDTLVTVIFLGVLYFNAINIVVVKKPIILAIICLVLFIIINGAYIQGINQFNSNSRTVGSIFLILLSLLYFYQLFSRMPIIRIEKDFMFWISVGVLFYYSGTSFLFVLYRNTNFGLTTEINTQIWIVNSILNILQNILFGVAILCQRKK